jgi:hypothetical protein
VGGDGEPRSRPPAIPGGSNTTSQGKSGQSRLHVTRCRRLGDSPRKWRQRLGVPQEVSFKTPGERAWEPIERALAADLPFDRVGVDARYGRRGELRARCARPADTHVYRDQPVLGLLPRPSPRGRPPSALQVLTSSMGGMVS